MGNRISTKSNAILYAMSVIVCIIILVMIYNLGQVDISKPIVYEGDSISASYLMKTVEDTGWYLENPYVGGSYGGDFYDYVMSDGLSMLLVKIVSFFTNNIFVIYNTFYFLTYILVTITCLYALIQLEMKKSIAFVCSLLYAFLPFHQQRIAHIWLEPYFLLPLVSMIAVWIITDQLNLEKQNKNIIKRIWENSKLRQAFLISFLASSTGLYYAFFTCCLYAIALLINLLKRSNKQQILQPIFFIMTTIVGVILNSLPHLVYLMRNGNNPASELVTRSAADAEMYGLKIIQLLLPRLGHRVPIFDKIATLYLNGSPLTNENHTAALGIIGGLGFILLMLKIFSSHSKNKLDNGIALLNLGTVLIAIIGGIGAIFSYGIKTPMRAYNRLSLVIAFFALLYIGIVLSRLAEKYLNSKRSKPIYYLASILLLTFGIFDQTVSYTAADQKSTIVEYENDKRFIKSIEATVPSGSMIYQLPHTCFPSGGQYSLLKGYINSDQLKWSYPSMQGREQDLWEHYINSLPLEEMLLKLSLAGYDGIYIDTALYTGQQDSSDTITQIADTLNTEPIYSDNRRLIFFDMKYFNENVKSGYTEENYEKLKKSVYTVINMAYTGEFSILERNSNGDTWRWSGSDSTLNLVNPTDKDMELSFSAVAIIPTGDSEIAVSLNNEEPAIYQVSSTGTMLDLQFILKPGENSISFRCDAPRYEAPPDTRELVFYLWNEKITY